MQKKKQLKLHNCQENIVKLKEKIRKKWSLLSFNKACRWWRTFLSLRIGDLQVAVCGLESFSAHNLLLKLAEGDIQPIKRNCVVVQFGIKFIVNTRHFHRSNHINQAQLKKKKTCVVR